VLETTWWREGYRRIAGVDEAGRGALFGPVVAAGVVLPVDWSIEQAPGLADSKLLTPDRRESLYHVVVAEARAWAVGVASAAVVDEIGIVRATLRAMSEALAGLGCPIDMVVVDGLGPPPAGRRACTLIDADRHCASVAAASIVAKVTRDRMICELAHRFPAYGLERNKGYSTPEHLNALASLGPSPLHRRTFAPVAAALRDRDSASVSGATSP